jgi:ATP-binding cassette, subfamily B, bacterial
VLTFDNVSYRYDRGESWALRNVSFTLRSGQVTALVGKNGSGKSTLAKLLLRLYEPTEGRILLDGVDLREYDRSDFWEHASAIFQDFVKYNLTVHDNIAVGNIAAINDRKRVVGSAIDSSADQFIERLPRQYDQLLGKWFAGGVDLSGGEWQRMALARSYVHNPGLLVLDEPASALDARSEYESFERFRSISRDRTVLLISHRFSTLRMADMIVVLDEGRVSQQGLHEELMASGGLYSDLFRLQAGAFR